jgi:hypothetical protein
MSQKDMLKNEVLEEVLRERSYYYFSKSKIFDFWIILSPKFIEEFQQHLELNNYFNHESKIKFYSIIISSNSDFINWLKLRIGDFIDITLENDIDKHTKNGICGVLSNSFNSHEFLSQNCFLDSKFISAKYNKIVDIM